MKPVKATPAAQAERFTVYLGRGTLPFLGGRAGGRVPSIIPILHEMVKGPPGEPAQVVKHDNGLD